MKTIDDDDIAFFEKQFKAAEGRRSIAVDAADMTALAVGDYILTFAAMEAAIDYAIALLLHAQDKNLGSMVVAHAGFSAKLDLLGALHKYRCSTKGERDAVDELINGCRQVAETRNRIVHADWAQGHRDDKPFLRVVRARAKDGLRVELVDMPAAKLVEATTAAGRMMNEVYDVFGTPAGEIDQY
jgi:hypothetical protein